MLTAFCVRNRTLSHCSVMIIEIFGIVTFSVVIVCVGAFSFVNRVFSAVESIDNFDYYVPFDNEDTFNLFKFFLAANKGKIPWNGSADNRKMMGAQLARVRYGRIADAVGLTKNDVSICYIRPRFVPNYSNKLASFRDTCYNKLVEKFSDNWLGFMIFLYEDYMYDCTEEDGSLKWLQLTNEAAQFYTWLKSENKFPFVHRYMHFPFLSRVAETMLVHRLNNGSNSSRNRVF